MTREEAIRTLKEHKITFQHDNGWDTSTLKAIDMAIEALSAEPCEDAISRQAVLEVLKNNRYRFNISQEGYCEGEVLWSENLIKNDACKEIEQLPSVTPKQKMGRWIPVSERLPEEDGCYLVTTTGTNNDIIDIAYYTDGIWHKASRIKAWMPLPEPYKAESEEV